MLWERKELYYLLAKRTESKKGSGMSKQSECQDTDEDIQRRMMSNWKTSELDKIHKHPLNILINSYLSSKHRKCSKRLAGWSAFMKKEKEKGKEGGGILKTCK